MARRRRATATPDSPPGPARPRVALLLAIGLVAVFAGALAYRYGLPGRPADRPSVLLVTIDTLRADRLGSYGYAQASTPVLDALAARGLRFPTAVAHAPLTTPSHASILTGLTPLRHGVRDNGGFALPPGIPTLGEVFQRAGYHTAAFVSGFPLDRRFGLARGFDTYDDRLPHGGDPRRAPYVERPASRTTEVALRWLERTPAPWFVWIHYFDPHAPYEPPGELSDRFRDRPYDGEVAFVDQQIGHLLARLEGGAARDRTLILVTADHGESLGEHGEDTHGVFVYDSTLLVPWIMAGPAIPRGNVSAVVARGIDVAPTLLDYAGVGALPGIEGRSLRPAADGTPMPDAPAYAESLFASLNLGWAELHAWRTARWKLIEAPRVELYALDADAAEARNLAEERREVAEGLRRRLRDALAAKTPGATLTATEQAQERLRALGYLGGDAPSAPSQRDPKDGIVLLRRLERGLAEARSNPSLAVAELSAVLQDEPRMPLARRYRAIAHQAAGRYDAAMADIRALEKEGPLTAEDLVLLAETQRLARRPEEALASLDRAARLEPRSPEPPLIRGRALRALGRSAEAEAAYRSVLALVPDHVEAQRGLAELAIERGSLEDAGRRLGPIVARDPDDVDALVKLGVVRVRSGRLDEALALFQRAVALSPRDAEALLDLAGVLAKSGRPAEAVPFFERAIEAGGPTTVALNGLGFARLEAGDDAGAIAALRQSLALKPSQPRVAEAVSRLAAGRRP